MRYEDVVLADGPVGYWPLTELTGTTAIDRGSTGVNGAWTNTPVLGAVPFPASGRAPYLGASPFVDIADNAAWSPGAGASGVATFEAWARPAVVHASRAFIMSKGAGVGSYEWQLAVSSTGAFNFDTFDNSGNFFDSRASGIASVGRWHHVVGTYDKAANIQVLYLNGRVVDSGTIAQTMSNQAANIQIGRRADGSGSLFNGHIAHCAIYNKVLSGTRVAAHYRAGVRPRVPV